MDGRITEKITFIIFLLPSQSKVLSKRHSKVIDFVSKSDGSSGSNSDSQAIPTSARYVFGLYKNSPASPTSSSRLFLRDAAPVRRRRRRRRPRGGREEAECLRPCLRGLAVAAPGRNDGAHGLQRDGFLAALLAVVVGPVVGVLVMVTDLACMSAFFGFCLAGHVRFSKPPAGHKNKRV
ncbi:hypothetical protein SEVIR_5G232850v4 [Setaria viridis]|uniref:Uncharacterized protein n=1 Tax=Setaria viridis TaxID=4556 RepID=A0A4U6UVX0_SETVI|nr:hypothetical protein SEVIR_5G232850v2 [Setaria viridis]